MNAPAVRKASVDELRAFEGAQARATVLPLPVSPLPGFTAADVWNGFEGGRYLAKTILGQGEVSVLFGKSGHFKSVIAIDLAMCIGLGVPFHGIPTRRGAVLYVAGEGHVGIKKRLRAWALKRGMDASSEQPWIYVTKAGTNLCTNSDELRATVEAAGTVLGPPVVLVVIDTLAANFGQGDENHASDMAFAISNARAAQSDAAVLLVHHSGHGAEERERGSGVVQMSADYRLRAKYDEADKLIELSWFKVKDDERPEPMYFSWKRVNLDWQDGDGEELSSVVLEVERDAPARPLESRQATNKPRGLGEHQQTIIKVLQRLQKQRRKAMIEEGRDEAEGKVFLTALRGAVVDEGFMDRKRYSEALSLLIERSLVQVDGNIISTESAK
jgi:hypothetical protein